MNIGIINALDLLQGDAKDAILKMQARALDDVDEIRLRNGRYLTLSKNGEDEMIDCGGRITRDTSKAVICTQQDIEFAFKTAFSYSLHSYSKELVEGYITTKGGNRVGICGTAVRTVGGNSDGIDSVKYISSLNIRIARERKGYAVKLIEKCFADMLSSVLIIGPPASGKTTLLRDISRIVGSKCKIALIDEQNEISGTFRNSAQNDIGSLTDVFVGYPKCCGISTAVRVMSPRAIIVDEIGTESDLKALEYALHSGVKLITAVHGTSFEDASRKRCIRSLLDENAFDYAVELLNDHDYKVKKID